MNYIPFANESLSSVEQTKKSSGLKYRKLISKGHKIILLLCSVTPFALASSQNDRHLDIVIDSQINPFTITLPANFTTGYHWVLVKYNHKLLTCGKEKYIPSKTKRIGAGGQSQFTCSKKEGQLYPAQTQLIFDYQRPWESTNNQNLMYVTVKFRAVSDKK